MAKARDFQLSYFLSGLFYELSYIKITLLYLIINLIRSGVTSWRDAT